MTAGFGRPVSRVARCSDKSPEVLEAGGAAQVAVAYTAGLAAGWDELPPGITQGVAMLAAHLFEQREDGRAPPAAVAALWRPWRRMRLAGAVAGGRSR